MIRWRWRRNWERKVVPVIVNEPGSSGLEEAQKAHEISEEGLRHAQARDPSVRAVGRSLRDLRNTNGFAADWQAAMLRRGN